MIRITAQRDRDNDGSRFTITQGFDELAKSLDRPTDSPLDPQMSIFISDDRLADLGEYGHDVLEQVRLAFWLEDARRLDWEIVDARGRVLRSSR
jgi:hypothetical protein